MPQAIVTLEYGIIYTNLILVDNSNAMILNHDNHDMLNKLNMLIM